MGCVCVWGGAGWEGLKETMSIVFPRCHSSDVNTIESGAADSAVMAHSSVSEKPFSRLLSFPLCLSLLHRHKSPKQK